MKKRSARAKRVLSWLPTLVILIGIAAFFWAVVAFSQSWWTAPELNPSKDQVAADGMSSFTRAGTDFYTAEGVVKIKLTDDSTRASEVGLESDGQMQFEPLVPLEIRVIAPDGVFAWNLAENFTITTEGDRIVSVVIEHFGSGNYRDVIGDLDQLADHVGWTQHDFQALETALALAQDEGSAYSASLPTSTLTGAALTATVTVEVERSFTSLTFLLETRL